MPTRFFAFAMILPLALAASGCSNGGIFGDGRLTITKAERKFDDTYAKKIENTRKDIADLQKFYEGGINHAMSDQRWVDFPLIGLAAGTLASVLYKGSSDLTIGLGLATGVAGAVRVYAAPQNRIQAYLKGYTSTACVSQHLRTLSIENGVDSNLNNMTASLRSESSQGKNLLETAKTIDFADVSAEIGGDFALARNALSEAILAGDTALRVSADASLALSKAPETADEVISAIQTKAVQTIISGSQDFNAARAELLAGVVAATQLSNQRDTIRAGTASAGRVATGSAPASAPAPSAAPTIQQNLTDAQRAAAAAARRAAVAKQHAASMASAANTIAKLTHETSDRSLLVLTANQNLKACSTI
ncbi:MAG: hypothetical protein ING44_06065 [Telmatospirillum sp.]|nr:hypothetical protein [Telmatospirillum sp.]